MTRFAENWVKLATEDRLRFVTSSMENVGALKSTGHLQHAERTDTARVIMLRSNANDTGQHRGQTAELSLNRASAADTGALRNGCRVGAAVIHTFADGWATYATQLP